MAQMKKRSTVLGGITNLSVLAPVKQGMVIGFEPISYLERLRKVLDALFSARQNVRESELLQPVFPDSVGQFGIIDHFRYAIVPPVPELPDDQQPDGGTWRLSLNVTFDGGWEPYMRVIYRDLGALLDLLFCHCDGYPGSLTSTYEDYCAWVRRNEVAGGTFYADSVMPLGDQDYLAEVERVQREKGHTPGADAAIARVALPSSAKAKESALERAEKDVKGTLVLPLRTLAGLYRLSTYFPSGNGDNATLRRFAQSILQGSIELKMRLDKRKDGERNYKEWAEVNKELELYRDQLDWLAGKAPSMGAATVPPPPPPPPAVRYDPTLLQGHILATNEPVTHGCVVLLRVSNAGHACTALQALEPRCGPLVPNGIAFMIGFTHAGLAALGIAASRLNGLPQEFVEGMEARCSLLGDVRANHPDRWRRPLRWGMEATGRRVDIKAVHVLVQMRLADPANASADLHPLLKAEVDALNATGSGLRVLAVQPTRSYRNDKGEVTGHLNFVDGVSQPKIYTGALPANPPLAFDDRVRPGELLLGHATGRGDAENPALDPLKMNGTFLVVRKMRQNIDTLNAAMSRLADDAERDELQTRMMGRNRDGTALVPLPAGAGPNEFNYDSASDKCPFQSHVRRANPRDGRSYMPRIFRRGMSYGPKLPEQPDAERGSVFMAYCASLSEQFETLQGWITGANSSGVGSAQADPFLRVPQVGEKNTFRYVDDRGNVVRFDFDHKPLAHLEWGLYVFVPSLPVLKTLAAYHAELPTAAPRPRAPGPTPAEIEEAERDEVRQQLDDPDRAPKAWELVRGGITTSPQDTPYGHLLGTCDEVVAAMKDDGTHYSVEGYGDRMTASIGLNLLGMDPGPARDSQLPLNDAILNISEQAAYELTMKVVKGALAKFPDLPSPIADDLVRRPIDLVSLGDGVMAKLCSIWIGLPDPKGAHMVPGGRLEVDAGTPRCPGNFATASRYIFSPQPRDDVKAAGKEQGKSVLKAVKDWLADSGQLGTLAIDIKARLAPSATVDDLALSIAGVLLGFPPTVEGNFIRTMETWIKEETLWQFQDALFEATAGADPTYDEANAALRKALLGTMRKRPVPEMLWRCPVDAHTGIDKQDKHRVVLGIASALTDPAAPDVLMFGRNGPDETNETVHGCPGYHMAMGVMLAMIAGLLNAGVLRPTGSPVLLILTPNKAPAPA
ncbi:Dyp-type peroxidase [Variovorax sp. J22R24]|uniref:Dyp-type peroxidase domain-containing protein n=1 Tax=Variovorax gracilis TaxID=3053502 RepID=UPI002578DE4A|nr:Dyp-type peroxidase domain-containing protein [Variovorax sp. J22R24]MDM0108651.1 Dyp-type peroxidase [Variovorax sp. J22R24]